MHFVKTLLMGEKVDSATHNKFTRYGKGEYEGPFVKIKIGAKNIKVSGSIDYVEPFGRIIANSCSGPFTCSGKIGSKSGPQIKEVIESFVKIIKSKEKGVFVYEIETTDYSKDQIAPLYDELENEYVLLNLKSNDEKSCSLKTKTTLPKPGKQNNSFFSASLSVKDMKLVTDEILFDLSKKDAKEIVVAHTYVIKQLVIPEEYKSDFALARKHAKRMGVIKRTVTCEGEVVSEKERAILV